MQLYCYPFTAMGCPCELRLYAESESLANQIADISKQEAKRFEQKFSRYLTDSVTTQINQSAGAEAVNIDAETAAVLAYSNVCYEQSDGAFDITSGVLREVWHHNIKALPTQAQIDDCLTRVGWHRVELTNNTVKLTKKGMQLDFGGVVKEYAADAIGAIALANGIEHGLINLGGDIRVIGPQPEGEPWLIGITHPTVENTAIASITLSEGGLTTSGGYERYFEVGHKRYSHLINPKTGWPVNSLLSATVIAPQAIVAGSLTSIALLRSEDEGLDFLQACGLPYFTVDQSLNCHGTLEPKN